MTLTLLGSIGLGLVWGWLLGGLSGTRHRPRQVAAAGGATVLYGAEVFWLGGSRVVIFFLSAAALALLLRAGWQSELRRRFG